MKMLTIRPEQMQVMRHYMRRQFQLRMLTRLRKRFPAQTSDMDDKTLLDLIEKRMEEAAACGVRAERDVQRFLEYAVELNRLIELEMEGAIG